MKFRSERDDLLEAVQFASRAITNRATLPVLAGLRIEANEDGSVKVAATDLELTMQTGLKAAVDEPGKAIVPGRLFGEMTRSLGVGQVSVASGDGEIEISSGRGEFRVKTLAPDDYPALPTDDRDGDAPGSAMQIEAGTLAAGLSQAIRSASTDESRQVLTGVLWELAGETITLAATDSYRLGVRTLKTGSGEGTEVRVVVPARALGELARSLAGRGGTVSAHVLQNLILFSIAGSEDETELVIGSRFIEGEFPKYKQLIPEGYTNKLVIDKDRVLDVVRRVGLLAQNNMPVKFHLGPELEVSAHTPDVGEGQEILEAEYEGEEFVIAFNPQFFIEGGSAIQGEQLILEAGDGLKPAILRGRDDPDFTYLLMPVRLS